MMKCHENRKLFAVLLLIPGILYGCVTTKDYHTSASSKSETISQQTQEQAAIKHSVADQKEDVPSNTEVFALFKELQEKYKDNKSNNSYINELNDFEDRYGPNWNARGLISIEKGNAYYHQALENLESPSSAVAIFGKSVSEFQVGLNSMAASDFEGKDAVYSKFDQLIYNSIYCESRYFYLSSKIKSLNADSRQKPLFLKKYQDLFNDSSCPIYVRAWAVGDSISYNTDQMEFKNRVNEAYLYIKNSTDTEEIIYITSVLAWAEYSLGNFNKSISLYDQLDDKKVIDNSQYIYNAEELISRNQHYRKIVENALENKRCNEYWNTVSSSKRNEKLLVEIVNSYIELHDLANKGRRETTPVYETLSYSGAKIVVDYNVSPLLFKVQSAAERLAGKIEKFKTDNYTVFFLNMLESVIFLQKSVDFRIKGYYLKKKDYRGEWEKADAYMDESRGLFSMAIENAVEIISGREFSQCIIDDWKNYIKVVSDMSM